MKPRAARVVAALRRRRGSTRCGFVCALGSRMCAALALLAVAACAGRAEIIDRVAVTVGDRVITENQIAEAARLTAFLNGDSVDLSPAGKRKTADRLVEQVLLRREMDLMHFSAPDAKEAAPLLAQVKSRFRSQADFQAALRRDHITQAQVNQVLLWQLTTLRFIEFRFRPAVQVSNADLHAYYQKQVQAWEQKGVHPIPTFRESREELEKTLTGKGVDEALDRWLAEARTQTKIVYHDEAFR